jgi:hypothetical protein
MSLPPSTRESEIPYQRVKMGHVRSRGQAYQLHYGHGRNVGITLNARRAEIRKQAVFTRSRGHGRDSTNSPRATGSVANAGLAAAAASYSIAVRSQEVHDCIAFLIAIFTLEVDRNIAVGTDLDGACAPKIR